MTHPPIKVGSLVIAKRASGVNVAGERGVCYEVYRLGGRPGYSVLPASTPLASGTSMETGFILPAIGSLGG